jgi:predicted dehydrogenase
LNPLRIGIVGAGHLGKIHARLLSARNDVILVGVTDPSERARAAVSREIRTDVFDSLASLVDKIDAAILAVPTLYHYEVGLELLRQGKHLLIEKPLAARSDHAEELIDVAQRNGSVLAVGHVERFNPAWRAIASRLRDVAYFEARRTGGYTFRCTDVGVVLDLMVHDLDLLLSIVKSPVARVDGWGRRIFGPHEDVANARVTFENGTVANLTASRVSLESARRMHAITPRGTARVDFAVHTAIWIGVRDDILKGEWNQDLLAPEQINFYKNNLFHELLPVEHVPTEPTNALADEQDDFLRTVRTGGLPLVTGAQALEAVALSERIQQSIAMGTEQRVPVAGAEIVPLRASAA